MAAEGWDDDLFAFLDWIENDDQKELSSRNSKDEDSSEEDQEIEEISE